MNITFVTPTISSKFFSGGLYCIIKYADGLHKKGHNVTLIPGINSEKPKWHRCNFPIIIKKNILNIILSKFIKRRSRLMNFAIASDYIHRIIPNNSDITIATSWDTIDPVYRYGRGKIVYFMQHFETVFFDDTAYEKMMCEMTYQLPIPKIANSKWLYEKVTNYTCAHGIKSDIFKCVNAVDHQIYRNTNKNRKNRVLKVISYGGRSVAWKGFLEMAQAVALTKSRIPNRPFEWLVYGGEAVIPPDNKIAPYRQLGFLHPEELSEAYNDADILLSASWYESFPLFPIEAMACGLAVITTQAGTEDYAFHGNTAHIVEPQNVESISDGLCKLINDESYRRKIAQKGEEIAGLFTWQSSVDSMESILSLIVNQ